MATLPDPDAWLSRRATAAALTEAGLPTSEATLKTAATRDHSLPYRLNAKVAEYRWSDVLRWRQARVRYFHCDQQQKAA